MYLRIIGIIVVVGVLVVGAACVGAIFAIGLTQGVSTDADHVAVIRAYGPIVTRGSGGLFSGSVVSAEAIVEQIDDARENGNARAILLDIDSPGGGIIASQMIHEALVQASQDGVPIVAYFGDTAASGGYYIATPADHIVARSASITGSIGVIMTVPNLEEMYEKLGIDMQTITTGPHKDMLQTVRPLTDEEREILQSMADETYEDFVGVVVDGRDLSPEHVRDLADGRVYTGRQAHALGLVDELGGFDRAVEVAGDMAGLGSDPRLIDYTPDPGFWDVFFGVQLDRLGLGSPVDLDPRTLYLEMRYSLR
jgi:protease IV